MIKEISPKEAYTILTHQENAVLIDVRSTMEFEYVGHPINSVHISIKEPPGWETDPEFIDKVSSALTQKLPSSVAIKDVPLLMLCRSGKRSELGAELLIKEGYTNVYNVLEGFEGDKDKNGHRNTVNGWRFHDLPWEQS